MIKKNIYRYLSGDGDTVNYFTVQVIARDHQKYLVILIKRNVLRILLCNVVVLYCGAKFT